MHMQYTFCKCGYETVIFTFIHFDKNKSKSICIHSFKKLNLVGDIFCIKKYEQTSKYEQVFIR